MAYVTCCECGEECCCEEAAEETAEEAAEGEETEDVTHINANGVIAIKLHYKETPLTVTNFVGLAEGICLWGFLVALLILFV